MNLDDPFYRGRFDRSVRDSGAILVGAGDPTTRSPACFTNHGSRLDIQGWGSGVATLGMIGTTVLRANGDDARQAYTLSFSGTSSATPIVAGAAAAVNGSRRADGDPLLNSTSLRQLLRNTGTAQGSGVAIGPLPDLRRALPAVAGALETIWSDGVARGWAFHSEQSATSIRVHFYVDGPPGAGTFAGSTTALVPRPDVNADFNISGSHGAGSRFRPHFATACRTSSSLTASTPLHADAAANSVQF
jgi:hypothetical protein